MVEDLLASQDELELRQLLCCASDQPLICAKGRWAPPLVPVLHVGLGGEDRCAKAPTEGDGLVGDRLIWITCRPANAEQFRAIDDGLSPIDGKPVVDVTPLIGQWGMSSSDS